MREDLARFILLQMPDEMPLHIGGEFRHLSEQLLHLVFPEVALAGLNDLPHDLRGPGLRHGDESDRPGITPGAGRGFGDGGEDGAEIVGEAHLSGRARMPC